MFERHTRGPPKTPTSASSQEAEVFHQKSIHSCHSARPHRRSCPLTVPPLVSSSARYLLMPFSGTTSLLAAADQLSPVCCVCSLHWKKKQVLVSPPLNARFPSTHSAAMCVPSLTSICWNVLQIGQARLACISAHTSQS